jgi:putative aminopeptidase FrvX
MIKLNEEFLENYLNSNSPTGFEVELGGQKVWKDYISKYVEQVEVDNYGTVYGVTGNLNSNYKVLLDAHVDEISWLVNYIDSKGYIRVIKNGGSDPQIAPSMRVKIWGEKGPVDGIFGHPAIHISDRKKESDLNSIFIDVGASNKAEVINMGINIGTPITFADGFMRLGENFYTGRALDNRIGGFMIAEVARNLKKYNIELPFKLYIVNSVQEEVGLRGAQMITDIIKPNVAIITDVCHDTDSPAYNSTKLGDIKCGLGPVITTAPSVQNNLRKLIIDVAKSEGIDYQLKASSRSSGTNTESFAYSNGGVPSSLISLALKYMHTCTETVNKKDVSEVIKLIYNTLLNIKENHDFKYDLK